MWGVGCGVWGVGVWDVGCGVWDVGCGGKILSLESLVQRKTTLIGLIQIGFQRMLFLAPAPIFPTPPPPKPYTLVD